MPFIIVGVFSRVTLLIDSTATISSSAFAISLWNILYRCPSLRQPTAEYMMSHLSRGKSQVCQMIKRIDEHPDIVVCNIPLLLTKLGRA